jgi:hypothetical protein
MLRTIPNYIGNKNNYKIVVDLVVNIGMSKVCYNYKESLKRSYISGVICLTRASYSYNLQAILNY